MTSLIKRVVQNDLINGTRKGDKLLSSLITNAFTNLAAKPQFVNFETKVRLLIQIHEYSENSTNTSFLIWRTQKNIVQYFYMRILCYTPGVLLSVQTRATLWGLVYCSHNNRCLWCHSFRFSCRVIFCIVGLERTKEITKKTHYVALVRTSVRPSGSNLVSGA
jgi:hypothetical protein